MKRAIGIAVLLLSACAAQTNDYAAFVAAHPDVEAEIAALKRESAALVARAGPVGAVTDAPVIWRVPDALNEIRDCAECPALVVVPAGEYSMGTPPGERFRGDETLHRVRIARPFAVGKFEITFDEWQACLDEGGCRDYRPTDEGWGRGRRPVINVTWNDVKAYTGWLSMKTGKSYRLLSESEWEYAARAGTTTPFAFDPMSSALANYDGTTAYPGGTTGPFRMRTVPVGSFAPNAFGLYDMHGNAWEWVEDCWNDTYMGKPADGSPWLTGSCTGRVMRGGSWEDYSGEVRSGARVGNGVGDAYWSDGFRVARDL
jgi:formylglycine-generating enzyme required for sulfatase activity